MMATILREHTPAEVRALLAVEQATNDFTRAQMKLEMARSNYHHIADERERARQRGHLRLLRSSEPDRQRA